MRARIRRIETGTGLRLVGGLWVATMVLLTIALLGCDPPGAERHRANRVPSAETTATSGGVVAPEAVATAPVHSTPVTYGEAESTYREKRYGEAVELFTGYVASKPENPWGHYMLGLSAWKAGQPDQAERAFTEALARDPRHVKSLLNLSRVFLETDRPDEALVRIDSAITIDPASPDALRLKGRALVALGRVDEAIEVYRDAIKADDRDVWSMNNLGLVHLDRWTPTLALPPLARAVELAPEVAVFHNNLGMALERAGYYGAAVASYRRAVEADSSHSKSAASLARLGQRPDATTIEVDVATFAVAFVEEIARWREPTVVGSVPRDSVP